MKVNKFITIHVKPIKLESIKFTIKTRKWCQLPYKNHKTCPNYGKNNLCPPSSPYMEDTIKQYNFFYLVYADFDFRTYKDEMKKLHPTWTETQCGNLLYWQNGIKKLLQIEIASFEPNFNIFGCGSGFGDNIYSMESVGIDVFQTLRNNTLDFELKPKDKILLVCLLYGNEKLKKTKSLW